MDIKEYQRLKDRINSLQSAGDRAAGSLEQLKGQLRKEFGIDSVKEARKMLARLEQEGEKAEKEFNRALKEFEKKWGNKL